MLASVSAPYSKCNVFFVTRCDLRFASGVCVMSVCDSGKRISSVRYFGVDRLLAGCPGSPVQTLPHFVFFLVFMDGPARDKCERKISLSRSEVHKVLYCEHQRRAHSEKEELQQ